MTDAVTCPNCRDQLDVPTEFRGRSVKCATCQTVFAVPIAPTGEAALAKAPRAAARERPRDSDDEDRRPKRRGNGLVWFLLFGTLLTCGVGSALCGGFAFWMYNPEMTVHKSEEGKFQVEFPAEPVPFTQSGEKGAVVKGMEARREAGEMRFFVKYFDAPKKPKNPEKDGDTILGEVVKAEIAGLAAGAEVQRQTTTHAGFDAIDVQLEQGSQFMKRVTVLRVILAGSRIYVLGAQGQNLLPQVWYVQRFFISFQPSEKPKPAPIPKREE